MSLRFAFVKKHAQPAGDVNGTGAEHTGWECSLCGAELALRGDRPERPRRLRGSQRDSQAIGQGALL